MKAPSYSKLLLLLVLVLPLTSMNVSADTFVDAVANAGIFAGAAEQNKLVSNPRGISIERATEIVRKRYQDRGRVLSAIPVNARDKCGFEVRMLVDGKKVQKVFIDCQGRVKSK